MGGRGNHQNNSNNYYNSRNSRGRDTSYDHSHRSQPSQSTSNYPTGRGNGNFQSNPPPLWQSTFHRGGGFARQPPPWARQNPSHTPTWARTDHQPRNPVSWDQQQRYPNPQRPWNNVTSPLSVPDPPPPFSFNPAPLTTPPQSPFPEPTNIYSSFLNFKAAMGPKESSSTSTTCTANPPLGSKEDRELRLEVAKTLLKKSLEESKDDETCKSTPLCSSSTTPSAGQQKKKTSKSRPIKPHETHNKQSVCVPDDQVSENIISKSISAAPVSEEQPKRRVSLESNYVVPADVTKSATKATTPKRNRSNSFSSSGVPKTPEISTPSEAQNIKQRIIRELLGMSRNTLKEIISNPRSRKFEFVMKYMMKESRWKQSQIQRQVAQAGIDSTSESSSCELAQRDYEDLLSDPDLAISLSNLPPEMIETLGKIFNLGPVSGAEKETSDDILESGDISCLFDSISASSIKTVPFIDLSSPVKGSSEIGNLDITGQSETMLVDSLPVKSEDVTFGGSTNLPEYVGNNNKVSLILNIPTPEFTENEESSEKLGSPMAPPSPDSYMNAFSCFSPVEDFTLDISEKAFTEAISIDRAEDVVCSPSRPEIDKFSLPMYQEKIRETVTNVSSRPEDHNFHAEQEMCLALGLSSDGTDDEHKYVGRQEQSAEEAVPFNDKDPMFSTQSNSPTLDEDLNSCGLQAKTDLQNSADDVEAGVNNQLAMDGPLMSPDSFNSVAISNNEMMTLKSIDTVELDEPLNFFGSTGTETEQHDLPCADGPGNETTELSSRPQDIECPPGVSSEMKSCNTSHKNAVEIETLTSASDSTVNPLLQTEDGVKEPVPENNAVGAHSESCHTESDKNLGLAKIRIEIENSAVTEQESGTLVSNSLSGVEIGIQTDPLENESTLIDKDEMNSILKLLESSALPGVDRVKQLLGFSSNNPSVRLQNNENSPASTDTLRKSDRHIQEKPASGDAKSLDCSTRESFVQDPPSDPLITAKPSTSKRNSEKNIPPMASTDLHSSGSVLSSPLVQVPENNTPITEKPSTSRRHIERNLESKDAESTDCLTSESSVHVQEITTITARPSKSRRHVEEKLPPKNAGSFDCSAKASSVKEINPLRAVRAANSGRRHNEEKHAPIATADLDDPTSAAGILKSLQTQIKGLKPKDKLKQVFLKITDIENKIAMWADIKKELYQQVSFILEDEKSQSASSSQDENVASQVEPETNKDSTNSPTSPYLSQSSQQRTNRSGVSRVPAEVRQAPGASQKCETKSAAVPKTAPKRKRKRLLSRGRKTKRKIKEKTSVNTPSVARPDSAAEENSFVTLEPETPKAKRTSARMKFESEFDISEDNIICASEGGRSRSSKRFKADIPVPSSFSDSSPSPDASRKRLSARQSGIDLNPLPSPSPVSSPLRKTKAELKQMVFIPKPTEKRTKSSSVSQPLAEDAELHVSKVQKEYEPVVVKEEFVDPQEYKPETSRVSSPVTLRSCSVVLRQLDRSALLQQIPSRESPTEIHSVSCSSDEDELPLIVLSRKKIVESPSSSQEDIDISSVSSSDTAPLKLHVACPKSMKSKMEQPEGSHHHHHSSKHAPLTFPHQQKGAILDIKVVGKHVLAASEDGIVLSYSVKSGKLKKKYRGHSAAVTCICIINSELEPFHPEKMVTGSIDSQLRCFILKTGEQVHAPLQVGESSAIDANWGVIYVGTKQGEVVQINAKTFTQIGQIFECSQEAVLALKATKEGPRKVLVIGSRNQVITVRDADTGLLLRSVSGDWQCTVYSLLLDNSLVYCGTKEGVVPVFDFTCGQEVFRLRAGNGVRCLKSYNGLLFAGCYDGFIYVFKGQTLVTKFAGGKMIISMDFTKNKVIFSSKDKLQALNFPPEVNLLFKESRIKKVK